MLDLFSDEEPWAEPLYAGAVVLRRRAREPADQLLALIAEIATQQPFTHRFTPGGQRMSAAMTHCGEVGWASESRGYGYAEPGRQSRGSQPAQMPALFRSLAVSCATEAGFSHFSPDFCLINRYEPGAKMGLHQDKDERDLRQPIVSVSLGLPAVFLFGGFERSDATQRILLEHGDVVVWGGPSRLRYHGILPLKPGSHPQAGAWRYNLTFRRVC